MKQITKQDVKKALKDRWWTGLVVANVIVGIIVMIIIAASIEPREIQVITHFSSFGITGFYRSHWYHLWLYVLLELVIVVTHGLLSLKLYQLGRRDFALSLLWGTIAMSIIVLFYARSIIDVALIG